MRITQFRWNCHFTHHYIKFKGLAGKTTLISRLENTQTFFFAMFKCVLGWFWRILLGLSLCKIIKFRRKVLHSLKVVREYIYFSQEITKVREWIPNIGPLAKVIRFKLFLDIVPTSFADITRALRGCFRGGSVYVSFRFVLKQCKASNSVKMSSFWLQAKELGLSVCCNTFRNFNRSLNKRRMYPAQTITIE